MKSHNATAGSHQNVKQEKVEAGYFPSVRGNKRIIKGVANSMKLERKESSACDIPRVPLVTASRIVTRIQTSYPFSYRTSI